LGIARPAARPMPSTTPFTPHSIDIEQRPGPAEPRQNVATGQTRRAPATPWPATARSMSFCRSPAAIRHERRPIRGKLSPTLYRLARVAGPAPPAPPASAFSDAPAHRRRRVRARARARRCRTKRAAAAVASTSPASVTRLSGSSTKPMASSRWGTLVLAGWATTTPAARCCSTPQRRQCRRPGRRLVVVIGICAEHRRWERQRNGRQ
jgi:hypothetical protein